MAYGLPVLNKESYDENGLFDEYSTDNDLKENLNRHDRTLNKALQTRTELICDEKCQEMKQLYENLKGMLKETDYTKKSAATSNAFTCGKECQELNALMNNVSEQFPAINLWVNMEYTRETNDNDIRAIVFIVQLQWKKSKNDFYLYFSYYFC